MEAMAASPSRKRPLEGDYGLHLRYGIFDWDDNVVHMPTHIWMETVADGESLALSTLDYAKRRADPALRHAKDAFREFRDETGDFAGDLAKVMAGSSWKAPAFEAFKQAMIEGRLFAIVTSRGHEDETMRKAVTGFVDKILSKEEKETMQRSLREFCGLAGREVADADLLSDFFSLCHFKGVSNPEYVKKTGVKGTEEGKKVAIRSFVKAVFDMNQEAFGKQGKTVASISFGMSDDDRKNVETVDALMRDELSQAKYPIPVKFVVFDTGVGGGRVRRLKPHVSDPDLTDKIFEAKRFKAE